MGQGASVGGPPGSQGAGAGDQKKKDVSSVVLYRIGFT